MTNKEIIIKEIINEYWSVVPPEGKNRQRVEQLATNLLAKLQVLKREKIKDILWDYICNICEENDNVELDNPNRNYYVDQICQLIPEGEIIAEGKIEYKDIENNFTIGGHFIDLIASQNLGKNIIIKVVKK